MIYETELVFCYALHGPIVCGTCVHVGYATRTDVEQCCARGVGCAMRHDIAQCEYCRKKGHASNPTLFPPTDGYYGHVTCEQCGHGGPNGNDDNESVMLWNREMARLSRIRRGGK